MGKKKLEPKVKSDDEKESIEPKEEMKKKKDVSISATKSKSSKEKDELSNFSNSKSNTKNESEEDNTKDMDDFLLGKMKSISDIIPTYVTEVAKSGRAECRKCENRILKNELRVGIITDGEWGLYTKWQHLPCTIFHKTIKTSDMIDGYKELSDNMKLLVDERVRRSANEVDEDTLPVNPDELVRKEWVEAKEPSEDLLMPLLPYQKEGLGWMSYQETTSMRGGILADEMGMGKTIQAIALILDNRPNFDDVEQEQVWIESDYAHGINPMDFTRGKTLLVLPTIAIRQWQMEIARFTRYGSLSVIVYHGSDRKTTAEDLSKADIIITSYKVLEIEYRKATAGTKVECRICSKKFYPEKLRIHRKYFCGESAKRTAAQSKTEKKKQRIQKISIKNGNENDTSNSESESNDNQEDEEEDEIEKQKKMIKAMKEKKPIMAISKQTFKSNHASNGKMKKKIVESESEEDEISKQKKMIKAAAITATTAANVSASTKRKEKTIPKSFKVKKSNTMDENSEDEIDKQKRLIKAIKNKSNGKDSSEKVKKITKDRNFKKVTVTKPKFKRMSTSSKKPKDKNDSDDDDDDDDDDSEYNTSDQSESESDSDSESSSSDSNGSDNDNESIEEVVPMTKGKRGRESTTKSSFKSQKSKGFNGKDEDEDEDEVTREVEEDIKQAILEEAKKRKRSSATNRSLLHEISWFRIILDEAHLIKDRSTSTAKAIFNLVSLNKWCLTGTPLQNRVGELYSLVRFLRIDPHAYYFCKIASCTCRSLHYRFTQGKCDDCHHSSMFHFSHFNKHILNPIKRSGYINEGRKAMLKLKEQLLDEILLRRTKTTRADDIQLPPRIVKVKYNHLDDKEEDFYQALYTQSQAQFNTYVQAGTVLNNYAHIFDILIKLRQAVDHPYLVIYSDNNKNPPISMVQSINTSKSTIKCSQSSTKGRANGENMEDSMIVENLCGICQDIIEGGQQCQSECGHHFCRDCILDHINTTTAPLSYSSTRSRVIATPVKSSTTTNTSSTPVAACPVCNEALTINLSSPSSDRNEDMNDDGDNNDDDENNQYDGSFDKNLGYLDSISATASNRTRGGLVMLSGNKKSIVDKVDLSKFQSSTKTEALMQELYLMDQDEVGAKAIVFSQFVNMLDLLEYRITLGGIACVKLLGSMNLDQRDKAIKLFKEDPKVKVLLISLKAGGVALNLTIANHIFIMDPWWNGAAEMQAIDRTHRLGQRKPIFATRFIIENTIEERILKLQEKKRLVFDGTIGGDAGSMAKLTVDDMRFLFQ